VSFGKALTGIPLLLRVAKQVIADGSDGVAQLIEHQDSNRKIAKP